MTGLITTLGVLGVFLLMVPESACIPVPSEVTLIFSGFAVSDGWMSFPLVVLAATAGNVVGSLLAYAIGASGLVERIPGGRRVLARGEAVFERHGPRAVLIARLLPLARTFISLPAGARRVPLGRFVVFTTAGCGLWAAAFVVAGVVAGSAWQAVSSIVGRVLLGAGLLTLGVAVLRRDDSGPSRRSIAP
jgi:membrane protein DedA with SNARE-associated domain